MGLLTWWKKTRESRRRIFIEDALKHLHACQWQDRTATTESLSGTLKLSTRAVLKLCKHLESHGSIRTDAQGLHLTPKGAKIAIQVIRAHRLWERFLADEARMPLSRLHAEADRREHRRPTGQLQALDAAMGHPATDPHGDPIPTPDGKIARSKTRPLTDWPIDTPAVIVHLEDEPAAVFSQIAAQNLKPGQRIKIIESDNDRLIFFDENETHTLAPIVAANIFVAPTEPIVDRRIGEPLTTLRQGHEAIVHSLDKTLQGYTRRRLLDLGLTPGARIRAEYQGFLGDPVAYRVRGSLIALRRDQAKYVLIKTNGNASNNVHSPNDDSLSVVENEHG